MPGLMRLCAVRIPPQQGEQGSDDDDKHKAIVRPATLSESGLQVKVRWYAVEYRWRGLATACMMNDKVHAYTHTVHLPIYAR